MNDFEYSIMLSHTITQHMRSSFQTFPTVDKFQQCKTALKDTYLIMTESTVRLELLCKCQILIEPPE